MYSDFSNIPDIRPGITAVIGSGGKTTLIKKASERLSGTVLLTTSTHIFPFDDVPLYTGDDISELQELLRAERVVCVGTPAAGGKLTKPDIAFHKLAALADYVLVEADGSKHLPLKAHASFEPVIPEGTNSVIWVIGASGFNRPVCEVVHRPEIFCDVMQVTPETPVTEQMYRDFVRWEIENHPLIHLYADPQKLSIYIRSSLL